MPAKTSKFVVELKGIKLPAEMERRIATDIQEVVMKHLASLDSNGDLRATFLRGFKPPGPIGIWVEEVLQRERFGEG